MLHYITALHSCLQCTISLRYISSVRHLSHVSHNVFLLEFLNAIIYNCIYIHFSLFIQTGQGNSSVTCPPTCCTYFLCHQSFKKKNFFLCLVYFLNGLGRFLLAAKNKIFLYEADDDNDADDDKG